MELDVLVLREGEAIEGRGQVGGDRRSVPVREHSINVGLSPGGVIGAHWAARDHELLAPARGGEDLLLDVLGAAPIVGRAARMCG